MKQVLTQQEIDSLLNAMSNGEIDESTLLSEEKEVAQVKTYDFRRPTKLSKEYINTLFMIFEDFSKYAGNHLSTQVRTNVSLKLASIEQISYDEFIHSIPKFTLLGLFHSTPLSGVQMFEINPQFCMMLVELLCGGNEAQILLNEEIEKKSFTDIEIAILEEIFKTFVSAFESAWKEIADITSTLDSLDTNPQLLQNMSPNEPVILITFTATMFKRNTFINLCVPYVFFENIIDKLSFRNWFDSDKSFNVIDNDHLQKNIETVDLNLETILGKTVMTLSDFSQLEIGDAISLDQKITEPLKVYIENQQFGLVKPGRIDDKLAVELLEFSEGESEK